MDLQTACEVGNLETVSQLIRDGQDVNALNELGITPIMIASANGHDRVVFELIRAGANVTALSSHKWLSVAAGSTALHFAAECNRNECGVLLVEAGADMKARNEGSNSPLDHASVYFRQAIQQAQSFSAKRIVATPTVAEGEPTVPWEPPRGLALSSVHHGREPVLSQTVLAAAQQVLDEFQDQFIQDMDSNAVVLELLHHDIISRGDQRAITRSEDPIEQNKFLYLYLNEKCTDDAFHFVCDIISKVRGNPKMSALGIAMKRRLETGVHTSSSIDSHPTSSGAHTSFSIDSHPTLEDMNKFIVREVAVDWKQVATFLGVEFSVIRIADTDYRRCEHACTDIFEQWLSWKPGTGRKKRTWRTVLSAVEKAGHKAFSQQLQIELFHLYSGAAQQVLDELHTMRRRPETGDTDLGEPHTIIQHTITDEPLIALSPSSQSVATTVDNCPSEEMEALTVAQKGQDLLEFEERYFEVVRNQAIITLKITKCTTIGPPRTGKTCFKYLLIGKPWDVEAGTASTDVMEAPEWVECYSVEEEGGAKELWKLITKEEQQGKLLRAVNTSTKGPTEPITTPSGVPPTIASIDVPATATPSASTPSETLPTTKSSDSVPTITSGDASPTMSPSGFLATTTPSESPPTTKSSDALPSCVTDVPHMVIHSDVIDAQPTAKPSDAPPPTIAFGADQKPVSVMQAVNALACRPEKLQDILNSKEGEVLGKTHIIHFIDTGGQAIYHDVHPVLITTPSIYFVVFSLKDIYEKSHEEQLDYFQRDFIQRPLRSIYTFGTKNPQEEHLLFHPVAPTIFIVGTHLDEINHKQKEFLEKLHEIISTEIGNKPYREFVQYDPEGRSFWAVDNKYAGREQEEGFKQYISKLRTLVKERSMEMTVKVPVPWLLLKSVMDSEGIRYCKYSELLHKARIRGYVRDHSPDEDLDTMLRLFHILGLFYHVVPKGCDKEDSLVFIDPDCLYSATSDFLMAAKEEIESSQEGRVVAQYQTQSDKLRKRSRDKESHELRIKLPELEQRGIVERNKVFLRMEDNTESIKLEMQAVLQSVEYHVARFGQEPVEVVLSSLYTQLKEIGKTYELPTWESQIVASVKAKRQLFVGRLVHNLINAVKALLDDSKMKGDVDHVRKEVNKAVANVVACCKNRWVDSNNMEQFLSVLSELRIIAQLSGSDYYVVPAALPKIAEITADPILVTMLSQTVMEVCYLPSGLFCCLISELVTGLGWNVNPVGRTHVAFTHETITGTVDIMEHETYIKIALQLKASRQKLAQACQIVRRSVHKSIVDVYVNLYNRPTVKALVWGFQCDSHPSDETHIAMLHEDDDYGCYAECLLQSCGAMQSVTPEQMVWVHDWDGNNS